VFFDVSFQSSVLLGALLSGSQFCSVRIFINCITDSF